MEDTHRYDFSDYEQTKVAYMMSKKPSGVGIAGLAIGSTALLGMIGAWIFAGVYANAKSKGNERAIDRKSTTNLLPLIVAKVNVYSLSSYTGNPIHELSNSRISAWAVSEVLCELTPSSVYFLAAASAAST